MREIGRRLAHAGFLYSRIHGPVGLQNPAKKRRQHSLPSLFCIVVGYATAMYITTTKTTKTKEMTVVIRLRILSFDLLFPLEK